MRLDGWEDTKFVKPTRSVLHSELKSPSLNPPDRNQKHIVPRKPNS